MILGIDPGLDGGLAVIDPLARRHAYLFDMPTVGETPNRLVDARALSEIAQDCDQAVLEHVQSQPTDSAGRAFKMGRGIGAIIAVLQVLEIPYVRVSPVTWKKHYGLIKTGKEASRLKALELYPSCHGELKRKKDHNRAEALLMAAWALSK